MGKYQWIRNVFLADEFNAPFTLEADSAYLPTLKEKLKLINIFLRENNAPDVVCAEIKNITDDMIRAMEYYYRGDIGKSQDTIYHMIKNVTKMPLAVSQIEDSISFIGPWHRFEDYRKQESFAKLFHARLSPKVVSYTRNDMMHIPFDKRDLMQPQRFSLSGLPCYYLASTSYCCWIEMDRPSESEFNVSAVRPKRPFKIFNLGVSGMTLEIAANLIEKGRCYTYHEDPDQTLLSLACLRVIAIATSFRVKRYASYVPFKSEYILSQLIMLAVKRLNLAGIAYFSKRLISDQDAFPICVNLALFAPYEGEEKESSICNDLEISEPVNYAEYKQMGIPQREMESERRNVPEVFLANKNVFYPRTYFHALDYYLQQSLDIGPQQKKRYRR